MSIVGVLDALAQQLDGTVLREGPVCDRMRARIRVDFGVEEADMDGLGACVVALQPPVSAEVLASLDALCREQFGRPLPPELRALWRRTNGISASVLGPDEDPADPALSEPISMEMEILAPDGVIPAEATMRALSSEIARVTHPDGRVEEKRMLAIPFFEVPDQGWYCLDPHRAREDGSGAPVIAYWHDTVSAMTDDPAKEMAACEQIATDLEAWLARWIDSGFDPFPHIPREPEST